LHDRTRGKIISGDHGMQDIRLPSPLAYAGKRFVTVEDASVFILNLPQEKLDAPHWGAARAAFGCALMEPAYLAAALTALELAMTLDSLIDANVLTPIDA
jgi:hypothetical protein